MILKLDGVKMKSISRNIFDYGNDIIRSGKMEQEKNFIQHGTITCYEHSFRVAEKSLSIARKVPLQVNKKALVRGALLHDYFLYDWHIPDRTHRLHGFSHAKTALQNAKRDFQLNEIEIDIIRKHMFPLNLRPPKYAESWIVCLADKLCASEETASAFKLLCFKIIFIIFGKADW